MSAALLAPLLASAGIGLFWLCYKSVDFFDNI